MNQYLFLFRGGNEAFAKFTPADIEQDRLNWSNWMAKLVQMGHTPNGQPFSTVSRVVQASYIAETSFGDSSSVVAGYVLLQALDIEAAVELAKISPIIALGGTVEIREIQAPDISTL
jgi:hypothetical protein